MVTVGTVAAAVSGSRAASAAAAIAMRPRDAPVTRAGTQARAASTAPNGSTATISYVLLRLDSGEITYAAVIRTIATHSSCSDQFAVRQVQMTFPKPNRAASRQISPKADPARPSAACGTTVTPNKV